MYRTYLIKLALSGEDLRRQAFEQEVAALQTQQVADDYDMSIKRPADVAKSRGITGGVLGAGLGGAAGYHIADKRKGLGALLGALVGGGTLGGLGAWNGYGAPRRAYNDLKDIEGGRPMLVFPGTEDLDGRTEARYRREYGDDGEGHDVFDGYAFQGPAAPAVREQLKTILQNHQFANPS